MLGTCSQHSTQGSLHPQGFPWCRTGASTAVLVRSVLDSWWLLSQLVILGIAISAVWREEVWGHPPNTNPLLPAEQLG